jgi:acetyl esterase/lipase
MIVKEVYKTIGVQKPPSPLPEQHAPSAEGAPCEDEAPSGEAVSLCMHIFEPDLQSEMQIPAAIVFFFGGGWVGGTPEQFFPHCKYLASRGMMAMAAEYRVRRRHGTTPFECVADGKSAIRWVRANADRLGIDAKRVVAAGGSAGGHVALCTAMVPGFDEPGDDVSVSCGPNAMVLFNPVVDTSTMEWNTEPQMPEARPATFSDTSPKALSPTHHVVPGLPPTLIFHGTADQTVPFESVVRFSLKMQAAGNTCELVPFEGHGHAFFNYGRHDNVPYERTLEETDAFLVKLGFLEPLEET